MEKKIKVNCPKLIGIYNKYKGDYQIISEFDRKTYKWRK